MEAKWSPEAPKIPWDRPPTRREVWEYVEHYYKGVKSYDECIALAIRIFCGNYTRWVMVNGWEKPPNWKEGDKLVKAACPNRAMFSQADTYTAQWRGTISKLLTAWGHKPLPAPNRYEEAA